MTVKTIGVIGLGSIGARHAQNLKVMGHKVIGYDPKDNPEMEFIAGGCDGIVIASPTNTHLDYIIRADRIPLFVEKPISDRITGLPGDEFLLKHVEMVGYNLRFHGCVKKAKQWIKDGYIGFPMWANFICAQYNTRPAYLQDGVILNWSHEIDLALYLLGNADLTGSSTRVSTVNNITYDDITDIMLTHHDHGCRTTIHLDYESLPEMRTCRIIGTKGAIEIDLAHLRRAVLLARSEKIIPLDIFVSKDSFAQNYHEEMKCFIDRLDGKQTIGCTGEEALDVLKICLEVRKQAGLP